MNYQLLTVLTCSFFTVFVSGCSNTKADHSLSIDLCSTPDLGAEEITGILQGYGLNEKSLPLSDEDHSLARRSKSWLVKVNEGNLIVEKSSRINPGIPADNLSVAAGERRYIGEDKGEFGGGLYEVENGTKSRILDGNITSIIEKDTQLYVFEGLVHLMNWGGSIHVVNNPSSKPVVEMVTLLYDAPEVVKLTDNGEFLIVGHESLASYTPHDNKNDLPSRLRLINGSAFWQSLYPTSLEVYKDVYVVGMRSGVAVITDNPFCGSKIRYFTE